jgi:hypothetical protein
MTTEVLTFSGATSATKVALRQLVTTLAPRSHPRPSQPVPSFSDRSRSRSCSCSSSSINDARNANSVRPSSILPPDGRRLRRMAWPNGPAPGRRAGAPLRPRVGRRRGSPPDPQDRPVRTPPSRWQGTWSSATRNLQVLARDRAVHFHAAATGPRRAMRYPTEPRACHTRGVARRSGPGRPPCGATSNDDGPLPLICAAPDQGAFSRTQSGSLSRHRPSRSEPRRTEETCHHCTRQQYMRFVDAVPVLLEPWPE